MLNKADLQNFEKEIATLFDCGEIKYPTHLDGSIDKKLENFLIKIFKKYYKKGDWICSNHRNHYHWLLSGRSKEELKKQILDGYSMSVFDEKFITSSIVGGITPIALGIALGLKLNKSRNKVLCFVGDAASECGVVKECIRYAGGHDLPILFIISDNNRCVRAKTSDIWGTKKINKVLFCKYSPIFAHAGNKVYTQF